jgi:protein-S-isoprenylcysteine O-methyltransferase Ste14
MRSGGSGQDALQGFKLGLLNGLLVLTAVFFVHREVWRHLDLWPLLFSNWSENVLAAVAVLQGYLTGAFSRAQIDSGLQTSYRWAMRWGTPSFLFLYVAASALCERLHFGDWNSPILRAIGVAIILASLGLRIWTHATIPAALRSGTKSGAESEAPAPETAFDAVSGPFKWIRHPDRAGRILFLVGTPLCFAAWVPLFALPGAVVLLNWHLNDLEAFCLSQLGEPYLLYKQRTKRLIPGIL